MIVAVQYLKAVLMVLFMIFVHELGHFLVAKRVGMKVERFALGYGPRLFGFRRGGTDYCIPWLPLVGGYVKIQGMEIVEGDAPPAPGGFYSWPVAHRAAVLVAGSLSTLVLALALYLTTPMVGTMEPADFDNIVVGKIETADVPFVKGDRIVRAGGQPVHNWWDIDAAMALHPGERIEYGVIRDGREVVVRYRAGRGAEEDTPVAGFGPADGAMVGEVIAGFPATSAGIKQGDLIVSVGGKPVKDWGVLREAIQAQRKAPFEVSVIRGKEKLSFSVTAVEGGPGRGRMIGISAFIEKRYPPGLALGRGFRQMTSDTKGLFTFLRLLVQRRVHASSVAGPLGIVSLSREAMQQGMGRFMAFMAFISLNFTIINLFPIPMLDGGHLLFHFIEKLRRRPLGAKVQRVANQVAFALLIAFFLFVTYNDVMRLIGGTTGG